MHDKIIVTNRSALIAKYRSSGVASIKQAIDALIAADAKRGIKSRLVYLDDVKVMRKLRGRAVSDPASPRENKEAIDAVFRATTPEYLMILGAIDVVPHQDLRNPAFDPPDDDPDEFAFGDLPYACDEPYSRDVTKFKGPTRVVGRLPDLTGAREPSHLVKLLAVAEKYRSRGAADYEAYFGLSAEVWRKSTRTSLFNVFGQSSKLELSPPARPGVSAKHLAPLAHFINCHGGTYDPKFYGQKGASYPTALTSDAIRGKIKQGTVAAVECCFGAELYDSFLRSLPLPICQRYLSQGAYGYFGSSTIAYGPAEGNGAADLITQFFLLAVLDGASLGRAALLARQHFVHQTTELDPMDLKTLGQFNLLGDPSIHPVISATATRFPRGVDQHEADRLARRARRAKLRADGEFLAEVKPTASRKSKARKSASIQTTLARIAREAGVGTREEFAAYDVAVPKRARQYHGKESPVASRYYVAIRRPKPKGAERQYAVAAVAKEVDGEIVGYRIYEER
jgi:hypothetical protein